MFWFLIYTVSENGESVDKLMVGSQHLGDLLITPMEFNLQSDINEVNLYKTMIVSYLSYFLSPVVKEMILEMKHTLS